MPLPANARKSCPSSFASLGAIPRNGSSAKRNRGRRTTTAAISVRRSSPPESAEGWKGFGEQVVVRRVKERARRELGQPRGQERLPIVVHGARVWLNPPRARSLRGDSPMTHSPANTDWNARRAQNACATTRRYPRSISGHASNALFLVSHAPLIKSARRRSRPIPAAFTRTNDEILLRTPGSR